MVRNLLLEKILKPAIEHENICQSLLTLADLTYHAFYLIEEDIDVIFWRTLINRLMMQIIKFSTSTIEFLGLMELREGHDIFLDTNSAVVTSEDKYKLLKRLFKFSTGENNNHLKASLAFCRYATLIVIIIGKDDKIPEKLVTDFNHLINQGVENERIDRRVVEGILNF